MIYICIGGFFFVVIVIVINCLFYRYVVWCFYLVFIIDSDCYLVSFKFKESKNKIFEGNVIMIMFYNNDIDLYYV